MDKYNIQLEIFDTEYLEEFLKIDIKASVFVKNPAVLVDRKRFIDSLNKINSELDVTISEGHPTINFNMPYKVDYNELIEGELEKVLNNYLLDHRDLVEPILRFFLSEKIYHVFGGDIIGFNNAFEIKVPD